MKLLQEGIVFLAYIGICSSLTKSIRSRKYMLCGIGALTGGILLLQAVFLIVGQDITWVLTMLPITAYLPVSVGLYLLGGFNFIQTTAVCTLGMFVVYILNILKKILMWSLGRYLPFPYAEFMAAGILLVAAGLLEFVVFRFLRKPLHRCLEEKRSSWLWLFFPILMSFLLLSYFYNSVVNVTVLILTLLTVLSVFLIVIWVMTSQAAVERMKQEEQNLKDKMQIQLREYEDVCEKMEAGRIYRHDMRHHLLVLEGLAGQSDLEGIHRYIQNMSGQLSDTEREIYCANSTVNAVLSACIGRARDAGCTVTVKINLPEKIPFDEMDICMVFANALENAVNACKEISKEQDRYIHVAAEFLDRRKLNISITNPCVTQVIFDEEGAPVTVKGDGHGIGWKSIRAVIDKYNGFFQCKCEREEFCFQAALFGVRDTEVSPVVQKPNIRKKLLPSLGILVMAIMVFAGCMLVVVRAVAEEQDTDIEVKGHSFRMNWGDTSFGAEVSVLKKIGTGVTSENLPGSEAPVVPAVERKTPVDTKAAVTEGTEAEPPAGTNPVDKEEPADKAVSIDRETSADTKTPADTKAPADTKPPENLEVLPPVSPDTQTPPDLSEGVEDMNHQIERYLQTARERFLWYAARKYEGYVQSDLLWKILRDDDVLLSVRYECTINAGGSGQYSRCFTLDKRTGEVLELKDLFVEDSDYVGVISAEVLRQMIERENRGEGSYFIPGIWWAQEDCFQKIAPDQNFYVNDQNRLVIVFDEYEVGTGNLGMPEFVLDTAALKGILKSEEAETTE